MKQTFKTGILGVLFLAGMQGVQAQPTTAAPTPDEAASEVMALFSDHYTTNLKPEPQGWGGNTSVTTTTIAGTEDHILATGGNSHCIFTSGWAAQNYATIHMDVWSATGGNFHFALGNGFDGKCVYPTDFEWPTLTANDWTSIDVPVSEFILLGLSQTANVQSLKLSGSGSYWVDNIYAYGTQQEEIVE